MKSLVVINREQENSESSRFPSLSREEEQLDALIQGQFGPSGFDVVPFKLGYWLCHTSHFSGSFALINTISRLTQSRSCLLLFENGQNPNKYQL